MSYCLAFSYRGRKSPHRRRRCSLIRHRRGFQAIDTYEISSVDQYLAVSVNEQILALKKNILKGMIFKFKILSLAKLEKRILSLNYFPEIKKRIKFISIF